VRVRHDLGDRRLRERLASHLSGRHTLDDMRQFVRQQPVGRKPVRPPALGSRPDDHVAAGGERLGSQAVRAAFGVGAGVQAHATHVTAQP
jgi:hypothetical protein